MRRAFVVALLVLVVASLAACGTPRVSADVAKPKVDPPAIAKTGVLSVGVDPSIPPFAGKVATQTAGLDVDVAAALAERLGLTLKLVPITPKDVPAALRDKRIDVSLGALPMTGDLLTDVSFVGSYASDGPALFSAQDETLTVGTLGSRKVGAQEDSLAFWRLETDLGTGYVKSYPTLRAAFEAMQKGEVDVVGGDALVGAYLARDFDGAHFAGMIRPATPLGVAVAPDATQLETVVRQALDDMSAQGVLDAIQRKWAGDLPALSSAETSTVDSSSTTTAP